jgi:ElaB/YqjD/DUF883 family membrane-anchored ribosome-binding protein
MPPIGEQLPEGTDQIIEGAARLEGDDPNAGTTGAANQGTSLVGTGRANDTGGNTTKSGGNRMSSDTTSSGGTGGSGVTDKLVSQVKDQVSTLRGQAGDKLRTLANDGKGRTETLLDDFADVINEAARAVEQRFGGEYSGFINQAAERVTGLNDQLRDKSVDDLLDDTRDFVRKSPGVALGIAAIAGFAVTRVLKTGLEAGTTGTGTRSGGGTDTQSLGFSGTTGSTGTSGGSTGGTTGGADGDFGTGGTGASTGAGTGGGFAGATGGTGTVPGGTTGSTGSTSLASDYPGSRSGADTTSSGAV